MGSVCDILTLVDPWSTMKLLCLLSSLFLLIIMIDPAHGCKPRGEGCDCCYQMRGGCKICDPPKQGNKCKCTVDYLWYCNGVAEDCTPGEECPANCKTYACCKRGGGNCSGYMEFLY